MIDRYSLPEMAALFNDEARFARWLEVELLATEAWAALGVVPAVDADCGPCTRTRCRRRVRRRGRRARGSHRSRRRRLRRRRAAAHRRLGREVDPLRAHVVRRGRHRLCSTLTAAADLLVDAASGLIAVLKRRAHEHRDTRDGRPHPRRACRADDVRRQARALVPSGRPRPHPASHARDAIAVGKLSGAVGTYSNIDPAVERTCARRSASCRCRRRR